MKFAGISIHVQSVQVKERAVPGQFRLRQNFPNPFNPETWLPYELPRTVDVQITIFDTHGQAVRTLDLGKQRAGYYVDKMKAAYWDSRSESGKQIGSGVYFYRIGAGLFAAVRKMGIKKQYHLPPTRTQSDTI